VLLLDCLLGRANQALASATSQQGLREFLCDASRKKSFSLWYFLLIRLRWKLRCAHAQMCSKYCAESRNSQGELAGLTFVRLEEF
jgi:hypothetical protein